MKPIHDLCDIVRQAPYGLSQGKVGQEGLGRLACLRPFLFAFPAFFRG
jgi:hypothetical protein